jgi:signal transduction histidine kinase
LLTSGEEDQRTPEGAALWMEMLGRLSARGSHAVRNPLNAAALQVELLRSRLRGAASTGAAADADALASAADAAAAELERGAALLGVVLDLARIPRAPLDLDSVVRPLVQLFDALGRSEADEPAPTVTLVTGAFPLPVDVAVHVARLAVGGALESACRGRASVECRLETEGERARVTIRALESESGGGAVAARGAVAEEIVQAVHRAGVQLHSVPGGHVIAFPPVRHPKAGTANRSP